MICAPAGTVERVWLDPARWASWVDGFGHVARIERTWPEPGAALSWDSPPGGRGRVAERVVGRRAGQSHRVLVEDDQLTAEQEVRFEASQPEATRVTVTLVYELKRRGPLRALVDVLFIRRAQSDALARTLARLEIEVEDELGRQDG